MRKGRKFGRVKNQRKALIQSLAVNLIMRGKIKTTEAKAKELRPHVERFVTYGKKPADMGFRLVRQFLPERAAKKLVKELVPKYAERKGGYTRIIKLPARAKDAAHMAFIEFV